jgi:hypothetical protein
LASSRNAAHRRDAEIAERDYLMENRQIPILHKPRAFDRNHPLDFLFVPVNPEQTKNDLLGSLSVCGENSFIKLYIISFRIN